jgi:hypothetical protein
MQIKGERMQLKTNRMARISGLIIGVGLTALTLNAQQGEFKLPVQAHWGAAILQPGEHTVRIPSIMGQTLLALSSDGDIQLAMPLTAELIPQSKRNYLRLVKINDQYYVDVYQSGMTGKRYIFPKPKVTQGHSGAEESEATLIRVTGD